MLEQQRRDYLKAMGIPVWIPRRELPFAAPSRLLPAEQAVTEARESQDNMALATRLHGQASAMAVLDDLVPPRKPQASARPADVESDHQPVPATTTTSPSLSAEPPVTNAKSDTDIGVGAVVPVVDMTPPRFALHFVLTGPVLWVCDDPVSLLALRQFAHRVAMAMQHSPETLSPIAFNWPFIDNPREDQSTPVARQALAAQWSFFQHHGAAAVVGFGEQAVRWVKPLCQQQQVFEESVAAVMTDADHKRTLWLALRSWSFETSGE